MKTEAKSSLIIDNPQHNKNHMLCVFQYTLSHIYIMPENRLHLYRMQLNKEYGCFLVSARHVSELDALPSNDCS